MSDYAKPVFFVFLVVVVAGMTGGFMAADRGRRVLIWCPLCALLPPFLLLLYYSKPLREVDGFFRKCVKCGEFIKWRASVCKYCKSEQIV